MIAPQQAQSYSHSISSAVGAFVLLSLMICGGVKFIDSQLSDKPVIASQASKEAPKKSKKDPPKARSEPESEREAREGVPLRPPPADANIDGWKGEQLGYAAIIVDVGRRTTNLPKRAWVIAVATAMQESRLLNQANRAHPASLALPYDKIGSDHDSVGLFQQRPDKGWGTPTELMDPRTAASKFYGKLARVVEQRPNWQKARLTEIAQAVQGSAFPEAYQKHESAAIKIVDFVLRYPYEGKKGTERAGNFVMFQCANLRLQKCMMVRWEHTRPVVDNHSAFKRLFPDADYKGDVGNQEHMNASPPEDHTPGASKNKPGWIYAQDLGGGKSFDLPDFFIWLADRLKAGEYKEVKYIICSHAALRHYKGGRYYGILSRSNDWRPRSKDDHTTHVHISYMPGLERSRSTIITDYHKHKNGA